MEMHLVHQAPDGRFMVVGMLIRSGAPNAALASIFNSLPAESGSHLAVERFDLARLLPRILESFRYQGSLTTPPFTEGVAWVVLTHPIELSPEQIDAFRGLFPESNSREPQPLNGRTVITDADGRPARPF